MNAGRKEGENLKTGQHMIIKQALPDEYIEKLESLTERLCSIKSRPIYISEEKSLGRNKIERYESAGLRKLFEKAKPLIRDIIGKDWMIITNKVLLRRTWPISEQEARQLGHNASNLTWHQDSNNKHQNKPMVVLMVSLQDGAGEKRPGLSILEARTEQFEGIFGYEGSRVEEFERRMKIRHGELSIKTPKVNRGDLIIFDGLTFHRTYSTQEMKSHRDALLIRLIRPEDKNNFAAGNHCMVRL